MNYEEQLKQMGITLEEQKNALSIIQSKKDELETQNNMLEAEAQRRKAAHETTTDFIVIPYRSDFLKEIEAALNETVVENENILKLETSLSESSDCTGLHELIVAVQEANQRCRELHINFEFHQQHIIGESGLEPTVRVCDTLKHLAAFWKPANFLQWLCQLRDYEPNDNLKELLHIDLSWEADDWKGKEEDAEAHKSSRILVNMHQIKQQLSDSIQHVSTKLSCNDLGTEVHKYYYVLDISTASLSSLSVPPWVSKIFKMKSHLKLLFFFTLPLVWYSEQNIRTC
ncbi:hypothetical protein B7P43_G01261 [Cryptotermes secundus]|nr:hypothetical protein B7P43_G01261 [Cryptotermes secundus]